MMVFLIFVFVAFQVFIHPQHEVSIISRTLAAIILITQGLQHNFDVECKMKMCFKKQGKVILNLLAFFFLPQFFSCLIVVFCI